MPLICYLYEGEGQVPYMEVLPETSVGQAEVLAANLLLQRPHYRRAELWDGERLVGKFAQRASPRSPPADDAAGLNA